MRQDNLIQTFHIRPGSVAYAVMGLFVVMVPGYACTMPVWERLG